MNKLRKAALVAAIVFSAKVAAGDFVNGVESFSGTTKDLSTWGQSVTAAFAQSNGLFYDDQSQYGSASYNTKQTTVSWGQSVRLTTTLTKALAGVSLFLTNNSAGANANGGNNSAFWSMDMTVDPNPQFTRIAIGAGSNGTWGDGNRGVFAFKPSANHKYILQITPLATSSAAFAVFDGNGGALLESLFYDNSPIAVPNSLHISLSGQGGSVTMHSVAIVPEPSAAVSTSLGLVALVCYRYKSRRLTRCR